MYSRTLEMVNLLAPLQVPLMATGGIETFQQVQELKEAGANLFGIATGLITNPFRISALITVKQKSTLICYRST